MKKPVITLLKYLKEPHLFFLVLVFCMVPLLFIKYFPSLDGPAHLHNSILIKDLISNPDSPLSNYFSSNSVLLNWLHHVLLLFFQLVLPTFLAEKLLVALYIIGLPLTFRHFIKEFNSKNILVTYIIFPFSYSFLFILGFNNFSIAIIVFIWILTFYLKHRIIISVREFLILFVLFTLLYFCHLFVFAIAVMVIAVDFFWQSYFFLIERKGAQKWRTMIIQALLLILASSFGLNNLLGFLSDAKFSLDNSSSDTVPFTMKVEWLYKIKPVISYYYSFEGVLTIFLFLTLLLMVVAIYIVRFQHTKKVAKTEFRRNDSLLISVFMLLMAYFLVPNFVEGIGGHMTVRISTILFIVLLLWIGLQQITAKIQKIGVIISILFSLLTINKYVYNLIELDNDAVDISVASEKIEAYSVVLPVYLSDSWLHPHFSNYLGVKKPLVILENYEAGSGSFPLLWNYEEMPELTLGQAQKPSCINDWPSGNKGKKKIDYIFIWGRETDKSCLQELKELEGYKTVQENEKYLLLQAE